MSTIKNTSTMFLQAAQQLECMGIVHISGYMNPYPKISLHCEALDLRSESTTK